jgi:hypothetical protein
MKAVGANYRGSRNEATDFGRKGYEFGMRRRSRKPDEVMLPYQGRMGQGAVGWGLPGRRVTDT